MKLFGGETELKQSDVFSYMTDSGRSSLRLILKSGLRGKKYLLPDFLCSAIIDVFDDLDVKYSLYHINEDLSIDMNSLENKAFDIFYVISYFGQRYKQLNKFIRSEQYVLEDNVFLPIFGKPLEIKNWIGFNSFRKISPLADGSLIKSTMPLNDQFIVKRDTLFSNIKYEAKNFKYNYIYNGEPLERSSLELFQKGEQMLEQQKEIFAISQRSLTFLTDYFAGWERENILREKNFDILKNVLSTYSIPLEPEAYSFAACRIHNCSYLKEYLKSKKIYLPRNWVNLQKIPNSLYTEMVLIPVDSRYTAHDVQYVADQILRFMRGLAL